jgi:hypothetical protein
VPIITFVNKHDRKGHDPFDEIDQSLTFDVTPASGPIGMGATFSAPTTSSPMRSYCSSAASTTGSPSRSAAVGSTTRNCRGSCRRGTRQIARGGRDGEGFVRPAGLSRGASDPGLFRQCAQPAMNRRRLGIAAVNSSVPPCSRPRCRRSERTPFLVLGRRSFGGARPRGSGAFVGTGIATGLDHL